MFAYTDDFTVSGMYPEAFKAITKRISEKWISDENVQYASNGIFRLWRRYPHSTSDKRSCWSSSGVCEVDSMSKLIKPPLQSSVNMMHAVASYLRKDIEVVITRRSWKFASTSVAKRSKSLVNTDFSGTSETSQKCISKNISKKIEYPMKSAERQFIYGGISKWS